MSFLYPSFLFALGAISIPIIIHLFDLQRPKKVFFTNVRLLRSVNEQTSSTRKLKNLLVLICRILFIALLVFAFAQPFIKGSDQSLTGSQSVNIYLDNSLSMQSEDGQKSLLDKAVHTLENIPQLFPPASQYFFLDNTFSPQDRLPLSVEKIKDRITEVKLSNIFRSFDNILKRQMSTLTNYSQSAGNKKIFWFSDFQKSTTGDLDKLVLDSSVSYYIVPIQNRKASNVYIDSVWLENLFVKENENNTLRVKLRNSGETEVNNLHLKLIMDDIQFGSSSVEIAPNSDVIASFDFNLRNNSVKKCQIIFEDRPIIFDNQYYFTIQVSPTVNIFSVSNNKKEFIKTIYSNETTFKLKESELGNISINDLERANLAVVEGFDLLNITEVASLKSAVNKGASLLLFPSEKPAIESLQRFSDALKLPIISNVTQSPVSSPSAVNTLYRPDIKNPFFANVFESFEKEIDMPYAFPIITWKNSGQLLLKTRSDEPFLSLFSSSKGKIYLCSVPLAEPSTNFQKHSLFIPVMYKMAINSISENRVLAFTFNDKNMVLPVKNTSPEKKYNLRKDDFTYIPEQSLKQGNLIFDVPHVNMDAGFYNLEIEDSVERTLAINPAKSESEIQFYSIEELKAIFANNKNVSIFENEINEQFVNDFREKYIGMPLWKYCIIIALVFLMIEILLIRFLK